MSKSLSDSLNNHLIKYELVDKNNKVYRWLNKDNDKYENYEDSFVKLKELRKLLRLDDQQYPTDRYYDYKISKVEEFSIIDDNKLLKVKGAKPLIDILNKIREKVKKEDVIESWKNINFESPDYELKKSIMFDFKKNNICI
ncbi:hypothetical protein JCM16358_25180 [Halanaerocella petrolearia]